MENLIKMDDLGVPLFLETPISSCLASFLWCLSRSHFDDAADPSLDLQNPMTELVLPSPSATAIEEDSSYSPLLFKKRP